MEDLSSGRGIQVLIPNPDHTFTLNEKELEKLFLRKDLKDYPAVVISIAGTFRKGKSFMLGFFLRYLNERYNLKNVGDNWLGKEDEPLRGFSWRGGSDRHTTGLLFWSQPFIATLDNGEKVVIYLMDTQGTFDDQSTVKDNATVFAISTMLSSVQIYNLSPNIYEDDLQHLRLFTDYGVLALDSSGGKPFQRLQVLVRDWSFPYDQEYGSEGGKQLLAKRLAINKNQHRELQTLRKHINNCFEEIACFLMPYPGTTVATNPEFNGNLADIDEEFKQCLKKFVPMLLAPENLIPKKIVGQKVKAKDMLLYFKSYINIFDSSTLPEPKTIFEATAEANNLLAIDEAMEVYKKTMAAATWAQLIPGVHLLAHQGARDKALQFFNSKKKMGSNELIHMYEEKLRKQLDEQGSVSSNAQLAMLGMMFAGMGMATLRSNSR